MSLEKLERIKSHEKFDDLDGILIVKPENVLYLLGFKVESEVFILIPREGRFWVFLNALEYDQAKKNIELDYELSKIVEIKQIPAGRPKFIQREINKLKFNAIGFEDEFISVNRYERWMTKFKINRFKGISDVLSDARLVKTQEELNRMKKASELGDIGFKAIFEIVKEGMTEKELAAEAEFAMRKAGSDGTSFDTIVASGEQSAYPHAKTSDKKVENGDLIIVDIGAIYNGYCSDMTRTFILGKNDANKARLVNLVNEGQKFGLDKIKAGLNCADLDKLVRDFFIEQHGEWGNRFIHSLGHGVGIDIHENPYLSPVSKFVLRENMVVTIEPGLYIPGLGGARTEDMVVIKEDGFISLTKSEKYYF